MILAILKFLGIIRSFFAALFKGIFDWIKANPKLAATILCLAILSAASVWAGYTWATNKLTAHYEQIIKDKDRLITKYEADIKERDTKILQVEADSKKAADLAVGEVLKKSDQLNAAAKEFARKLAEERKLRGSSATTSVVIQSPETHKPVTVTLDKDEVICSRFHDAFFISIKDMIKIANTPVSIPAVPNTAPAKNTPQSSVESPAANGNLPDKAIEVEKAKPAIPIPPVTPDHETKPKSVLKVPLV